MDIEDNTEPGKQQLHIADTGSVPIAEVEELFYWAGDDWILWDEQEQGEPYPVQRIFDAMRIFIETNKKNNTGAVNEYVNIPLKGIQNAIWGACFDYKDFDEVRSDKKIRDRIYDCWNRMHHIIKQSPEAFISWVKKNEPDI